MLTASMTDALGRTFSYSSAVSVHLIPEIQFTLPQVSYAGEPVPSLSAETILTTLILLGVFQQMAVMPHLYRLCQRKQADEGGTITL